MSGAELGNTLFTIGEFARYGRVPVRMPRTRRPRSKESRRRSGVPSHPAAMLGSTATAPGGRQPAAAHIVLA
ncbi:hypothetical protein, partial [Streptomyces milbemycinicus]